MEKLTLCKEGREIAGANFRPLFWSFFLSTCTLEDEEQY